MVATQMKTPIGMKHHNVKAPEKNHPICFVRPHDE